jgi:hypothetical protein
VQGNPLRVVVSEAAGVCGHWRHCAGHGARTFGGDHGGRGRRRLLAGVDTVLDDEVLDRIDGIVRRPSEERAD